MLFSSSIPAGYPSLRRNLLRLSDAVCILSIEILTANRNVMSVAVIPLENRYQWDGEIIKSQVLAVPIVIRPIHHEGVFLGLFRV